jgi:nicotinate-nucleotide adenylyltransferase
MSKLCLGGAFNPVHNGHLLCARAAAEALGVAMVVLIPCHVGPHKLSDPAMAAAEHRLMMCRLAVAGVDGFEIDDRELRRAGPSYTIDTVRELRQAGWDKVPWLLGADQVESLPKWHQPHDLLREAQFHIMARPGWNLDWKKLPPEYAVLADRLVTSLMVDISATDIRRRVAHGLPIDFLTPPAVCQYITQHGLYRIS